MTAAMDGPPLSPPPHQYPPSRIRCRKYRSDKKPKVSRMPRRTTLRKSTSTPLGIEQEDEDTRAITPSPSHAGRTSEDDEPYEKGHVLDMENADEDEDPEEDMIDIEDE